MYKLRLLLLAGIAMIVVSCHSNEKKKIQKKVIATTSRSRVNNPVMDDFTVNGAHLQEFKTFLKGLDDAVIDNATAATKKFQDLFKNDVATTCDTALILFNKFNVSLADKADAAHGKDTTIQYDSLLTDSNGIHSNRITAKTAQYGRLLKANGLRVVSEEDETYIVQDLDFEIKWFKDKLSAPLQQYLTEAAREDKEGLAEDAGLIISTEKVAERAIWWETFSDENQRILVSQQALSNWKSYVDILLTGMDNSPVVTHNPFYFNNQYESAYTYLQNEHPNSNTNKLVNPFFKLVNERDSVGAKKLLGKYRAQGLIAPEDGSSD